MMTKKSDFQVRMRSVALMGVLAILCCLLIADALRSEGAFKYFSRRCSGLRKTCATSSFSTSVVAVQHNFHVVAPGIWRSAQPNPESLQKMKAYGLKSLVNLRLDAETEPWENGQAVGSDVRYYRFPLSAKRVVPEKTVDDILLILSDPRNRPVLIHCAAGKDRTGMVVAAYKIANSNWPFRDIYQEMKMYGYDEVRFPAMLKTLRLWSVAHGYLEAAQEIALTEKKLAER